MCVRCKPGTSHQPAPKLGIAAARSIVADLKTIKPYEVKDTKRNIKLLNKGGR